MFMEDATIFDYHFYQSHWNSRGMELCSRNILHLFLRFHSILPESRDWLGFYCRASKVYNIMFLSLILKGLCREQTFLAATNCLHFLYPGSKSSSVDYSRDNAISRPATSVLPQVLSAWRSYRFSNLLSASLLSYKVCDNC